MSRLRVAILRADDHHHRYLEWTLRSAFDVVFVAVEPGGEKVRRMWTNRRYRNYFYNRYHDLRRRWSGKDRYRREYFRHGPALPSTVETVPAVNSEPVVTGLRRAAADVTVVIGCSILKNDVLAAAGAPIVNLHGGFLPDYKGNHCVFFALYNGEPDKVGVTIHHVNAGVDAGDLIEVVRPPVHGGETAEHLYCRSEKIAINRLVRHLRRLEAGHALPAHPQPKRGRNYLTRDRGPSHDLRMWWRSRFKAART
ncbi:formyl transferase [Stackebrandtia nassauensis]|uniref:phosphoribosylglycinamide formyltransferase 1 n=1 Tax=Stackebrandtia nassauensis (strain DSM 44728 / CIP 108903 / NRRL B-16338 / NBRC 102104 / LLR-40K-21) TaxID=446470 RepID=D3Q4U2_STANL|nr:formyl transferase [Stackebrandtia nassauensis]ADD42122.1 formyl transferase domain protein [Stackebrandtia nassauensis DSM 44728]